MCVCVCVCVCVCRRGRRGRRTTSIYICIIFNYRKAEMYPIS